MAPSRKTAVAECVSDDALIHLRSYKYSAVDKSPISNYILRPYWNAFVELLPLWLAPNMVTLLGFCFILANVGLLVIVMPDLVGPGPSWLYLSFAFGLFMYQTMDNVDGKQARRTGTSSGLGELFDHGIDSLNCTLASLLETAAMALGTSKSGVFTALCPCLAMFFSTWETYHTHTLYLGYFNGPTEGILIACSVMAISGIYGPGIWTERIVDLVGEKNLLGYDHLVGDHSIRDIWILIIVISLVFGHMPFCVLNVVKARRRNKLPVLPVFLEWIPMAVYTLSIGAWLYSPHSTLMRENHLVLFCLTMSFVFGRMTTKMILAHLTRQPFPYWTVMLIPLVGGAVLGNLPRFGFPAISAHHELLYLWAYFVFALVVYFRWAYLVTTSICAFLGINCLTIPHAKQVENKRKALEAKGLIAANGTANGSANGKKMQ
ncbi:CDP-alcohol phosphatidyltransferase [Xylaria curta]|nr:CDP-alcohol phosphatidyltransferase [Xylaria curta]